MLGKIVTTVAIVTTMVPAHGGGFARVVNSGCATCVVPSFRQAPVVHSYKAAVVHQALPNYYYQVGAQLQQQAQDTYGFRNSAEWAEFLQLRGYKAGTEQMLATLTAVVAAGPQQQTYRPPVQAPQAPSTPVAPPPDNQIPGAEAIPPATPTQPPPGQEVMYPTLVMHCSKCHTGDEPKGDLWLDGSVDLSGPDAAETRERIVRALWLGHMPPDAPADDKTVGQILTEIFVE